MPLARIGAHLLLFTHIPKTGGSSIEKYLLKKGRLTMWHNTKLGKINVTPQHLHRDLLQTLFQPDFYDYGFTVIRNPLDRLISEYRYRAKPPRRWQRYSRLGRTTGRMRVQVGETFPFVSFDEWVRKALPACRKNGNINDNHLRPQVDFVDDNHEVFVFENGLDHVFRRIDEVTNTPAVPTPIHEKKSKGEIPPFSDDTRALIEEFYAEDQRLWENYAHAD